MKYSQIISFLAIAILAASIRAHNVENWSLDIDEAFTIEQCNKFKYSYLIKYFQFSNSVSSEGLIKNKYEKADYLLIKTYPIYYALNKIIIDKKGLGELSLRIQSVIFAVLSVCLSFYIGTRYFDLSVGILFSILSTFHPLLQFHAQNARFYSLAYFASLLIIIISLHLRKLLNFDYLYICTKIRLIIFGIIIPLLLMIHITIVFMYIFTVIIIINNLFFEKNNNNKYLILYFLIPGAIAAIPVISNQMYFINEGIMEHAVNTVSSLIIPRYDILYKIKSLVFNFNPHYFFIFFCGLFFVLKTDDRNFKLLYISFCLSLGMYIILCIKINDFRFDYFLVSLSTFLLCISIIITKFIKTLADKSKNYYRITFCIVSILLVTYSLTTFLSTLLIDGDKFDWKEAAYFIENNIKSPAKNKKIIVYSYLEENLEFYLKDKKNIFDVRNIKKFEYDSKSKDSVIIVVLIRRTGFDFGEIKQNLKDYMFHNATFIHIVGKNRLDVHKNWIAIMKLNFNDNINE